MQGAGMKRLECTNNFVGNFESKIKGGPKSLSNMRYLNCQ
jgi:hypothetical protein